MCLALNIYHEARGEVIQGQYAVAQVTMRRADYNKQHVCREVFRPYQFSWTIGTVVKTKNGWKIAESHIPHDRVAWNRAVTVAKSALLMVKVPDYSLGATHYHTRDVKPRWSRQMTRVATIGNHHFYRDDS
jgi:spore germination cell wall hydrolase CwlJ-like protein